MKRGLLLLFLILGLGIILRVYNIEINYYFTGELGKELLFLRQIAESGKLPLTGLTTSHEWLRYGPFYYYFMLPIFLIFKGHPFILFLSSLFISVAGLAVNYFVFKKIVNLRVALFSTLIQAISPALIWQTRLSKLHVFFFILMPIFTYLLYLVWNGKKKWVFLSGIIFGLMFSFHFSQIPLLGVVILLFYIKKNTYKFADWAKFALGLLIPNLTLFWVDKAIVAWVPYRILKYAGRNIGQTIAPFYEFLGTSLTWEKSFWALGTILFLILLFHFIYTYKDKLKKDFVGFFLVSSFGFVFTANFLHGSAPSHYFLPVLTFPSILFAIYLDKFPRLSLFLIPIFLLNLGFYVNSGKFDDFIAFDKQAATANFIVSDAKGKEFSIKRVGPFDYFPENYSQNYKYLVLFKGGALNDNSNNIYIINDWEGSITK